MTLRPLPAPLRERLELAVSAFAEKGFERTRMEDVAEVTGIPKATLYYHFQGKEQVYRAVSILAGSPYHRD